MNTYLYLRVVDVNSREDIDTLYKLLNERTPDQAISHKKMPSFRDHSRFVKSCPYQAWYLIGVEEGEGPSIVGSTYITHANELGIFIFNKYKGKGYAINALMELMDRYEGPFYANINPANLASKSLFSSMGFKHVQETYVLGDKDA